MDYGVQTRGPYREMVEIAQWAERRELACFAMPDHYLASRSDTSQPAYDNLAVLAGLARETTTIRLATLVSPITFRHPAVLAKNAVTIDEMSGGRFTLGVGTGWLEREHEIFGIPFLTSAERWERMEEALGYLRAAFTPGAGFAGRHYTLESVAVGPVPSDGLQIVVGGTGPRRTPTLAGTYADEYNAYPVGRDELRRRIDVARTAASTAGRDPTKLLISSSGVLIIGTTTGEYRRNLERAAERFNQSPEELERGFIERDAPHGSVEQARHALGTLEAAGVQRFYVQALGDLGTDEFTEILDMVDG